MATKKTEEIRKVRAIPTGRARGTPRFNDTDQIIRAARVCFARFGVARTRLEDVAAESGISRPLLYQFFPNRQALMDAAINKEVEQLVESQSQHMGQYSSFSELVIEGAIIGIELARRDSILTDLIEHSSVKHLPELLLDPEQAAHHIVIRMWQPIFDKARTTGELRTDVTDRDIMEWLMNVHYMFVFRDDISIERIRRLLALFIAPALSPKAAPGDDVHK